MITGSVVLMNQQQGLDAAQRKLDGITKSAKDAQGQSTGLEKALARVVQPAKTLGLVATATAGSIAALAYASIQAADVFNDMADRTNLATERLALMDKIAKLADSSVTELIASADKLASKLAKQDEDTGRAAKALEVLSVSTKTANGEMKSSIQLQEDIVKAVDDATDKTKAEGAAIQLLGTDYYKLRIAVRAVIKDKSEMYDLMSSTGQLVTKTLAEESGKFNDHLENMGGLLKGVGNSVAEAALPTLNGWLKEANGWIASLTTKLRELIGLAPKSVYINKDLEALQTKRQNAQNTIDKLTGTEFGTTAQGERAIAKAKADKDAIDEQIRELNRAKSVALTQEAAKKAEVVNGKTGEGNRVPGGTNKADKTDTASTKKSGPSPLGGAYDFDLGSFEEITAVDNVMAQDRLKAREEAQALKQTYIELIDPLNKYTTMLEEIRNLRALGVIDAQQHVSMELEVESQRQAALDKTVASLNEVNKVGDMVFQSVSQAFSNMVQGSNTSFREMASGFAKSLLDMYVQAKIMIPLFTMLKQMTGWSWISVPGVASANGNVFGQSGLLQSAKGNAFGGSGSVLTGPTLHSYKGGIGIAGEAGDEAILPLQRGANGKLGVQSSGGGSGGNVYHISNSFSVQGGNTNSETAEAMRKEMDSYFAGRFKQQMADHDRNRRYAA